MSKLEDLIAACFSGKGDLLTMALAMTGGVERRGCAKITLEASPFYSPPVLELIQQLILGGDEDKLEHVIPAPDGDARF